MKTIIKIEEIKETKVVGHKDVQWFVAFDGKEFRYEKDCENYELDYLWENKIKKTEKNISTPNFSNGADESSWIDLHFYWCENFNELRALAAQKIDDDTLERHIKEFRNDTFPQYCAIESYSYEDYYGSRCTGYHCTTPRKCAAELQQLLERQQLSINSAIGDCEQLFGNE